MASTHKYSVSDRTTFETAILPILRKALGPIDDDEAPEIEDESMLDVPFTAAVQQEYFEQVSALLASSHGLINSYTRLSKQEVPRSRLGELSEMYRKDKETALSLLAAGRRVSGQDIDEMLADRRNEVRGRSSLTREDEQKGRMLLLEGEGEGKENRGGLGWG
jgi:hypothetical protein